MSVRLPEEAFSVGDDERGQSLGIDWDSYRRLASTALAIIGQNRPPDDGLYKKNGLAALDIFNRRNCLTIIINSTEKRDCRFSFANG